MNSNARITLGFGAIASLIGTIAAGTDAVEMFVLTMGLVGVAVGVPRIRNWFMSDGRSTAAELRLAELEARLRATEDELDAAASLTDRLREGQEFDRLLTIPVQSRQP